MHDIGVNIYVRRRIKALKTKFYCNMRGWVQEMVTLPPPRTETSEPIKSQFGSSRPNYITLRFAKLGEE